MMNKEEFIKKYDVFKFCYNFSKETEEEALTSVTPFEHDLKELIKTELTDFLDFLLKEGYCDTDVYAEPPTAIDQYLIFNKKK